MEIKEFAQRYLEMRDLQKEYFRTRSQVVLARSKEAERDLDRIARDIIIGRTEI